MQNRRFLLIVPMILVLLLFAGGLASAAEMEEDMPGGAGIVVAVKKAPIIPDGVTAGAVTDFVINLDGSFDPNMPGRTLLEGNSIRITLPEEFVNSDDPSLADVGSSEDCVPGNLLCTTMVLQQGWPQHPIPPSKYELSYDGPNTIVLTAKEDLVPGDATAPGLKHLHLMLLSFTNPNPGVYWVKVESETGPDGEVEEGIGLIEITEQQHPSIEVTSVLNEGAPNTIYQTAEAGELTPLPYDFFLWDWDGEPMEGVTVMPFSDSRWLLVQGGRVVGTVMVDAPQGAAEMDVYTEEPSAAAKAPVLGVPTAHLRAFFQAGTKSGDYAVTFELMDGNSAQMHVTVAE